MFGSHPLDLPKGRNNHKDVGTHRLFIECKYQHLQDSSREYERPNVDRANQSVCPKRSDNSFQVFKKEKNKLKNPDFNVKSSTFNCWQLNQHTVHATAPLWVNTLECCLRALFSPKWRDGEMRDREACSFWKEMSLFKAKHSPMYIWTSSVASKRF